MLQISYYESFNSCSTFFNITADLEKNGGVVNDELREKLIQTLMMVLSSGTDEECAICLESLNSPVITSCAHVFCRRCIEAVIQSEKVSCCKYSFT